MTATGRISYAIVLALALACYASLGAVLRLLPAYVQGKLGLGALAVGLAVGAPAMTAVVTRPFGGRAADRRGPRPVVLAGAVVMALAALPLVASAPFPALLASRLAVGAGEGLMMSAAVLWLLRLAGPQRRGRALGHIGLANYGGLTVGPLLADAVGLSHPSRIFGIAAALPVIAALAARLPQRALGSGDAQRPLSDVVRRTARAGVGLMLVNVGYVALLAFGSDVSRHGFVVPLFAIVVITARTVAASVPDRLGAGRTLVASCTVAAAGLALITIGHATAVAAAATTMLGAGQALAVPALGLLALTRVPAADHGAAAGAFFAWFDAGVALGGLAVGAVAGAGSPPAALITAAVCVACVPLVSLPYRRW